MTRRLISSGSPYEPTIGFSRAVRVGNRIVVSGTGPIAPDGSTAGPGDAVAQTRRCLEIIKAAVEEAGGELADVVRTRMLITDLRVWENVGKTHGEYFGDIRPASTMMVVKGLVREEWLVEIEAEAVVGE
jgi:enamine deaminase RidA (YjgF/YER057c/UK114 family)